MAVAAQSGLGSLKNGEGSDLIHFETQKLLVTRLSSTKTPQNPHRFFAIFIDFCWQFGPFSTSKRPTQAIKQPLPLSRFAQPFCRHPDRRESELPARFG